ncbi:MAG: hypothetical protein DRQ49_09955 [Gammaproteobacteria bacterium]|nr:MAG: hypothetical protein DRQ49_09955 [Gammaproteobacteria bacterium]RKZ73670.1 MAG: hypothetical protein DRQ57_13565 [Gammaproteobacteria bacterium]
MSTESVKQKFNTAENVFGYAEHVYINEQQEPFTDDPTDELPTKPSELSIFHAPSDIDEYFHALKTQRILLVDCFDDKILLAAFYGLVDKIEEGYEKKHFSFENQKTDVQLELFLKEKIGRGEKVIIGVDLQTNLQSEGFLKPMRSENPINIGTIKQQLQIKERMLICYANSQFIQGTLVGKRSSFHFPRWHIPFLSPLLKAYFNDDTANSLEKQILQQRHYGLWDENNSVREFYGLISGYLRNGTGQLREEVENRSLYSEGDSVADFLKEIRTVRAKELVQDDLVKNTVLYVATFFPGLNRHDFDDLVSLLLKGERTTMMLESQVEGRRGRMRTVRTSEERDAPEIWSKNQDKILKECSLQIIRSETGSHVIDFSLPYLREKLKKHLEQKSLYIRHFEKIQKYKLHNGILLNIDFNISSKLIENVMTLSAEMAIAEPSRFGKPWLIAIIGKIKEDYTKEVNKIQAHFGNEREMLDMFSNVGIDISNKDTIAQSLVLKLLSAGAKEAVALKEKEVLQQVQQYTTQLISRLSELIYKMLKYPQL